MRGRRHQRGQSFVIALAFLAALLGGALFSYNAGQVVNDKLRLVNAADAAALSAATWHARSLNFQSYLNRAVVANEVAIAQLVSLRSWSGYVGRTVGNAQLVASWVPPVGRALQALASGWNAVDTSLQRGLPPVEAALSAWNSGALVLAQQLAHVQAPLAGADIAQAVALENEPRAELSSATRALQARSGATWLTGLTSAMRRGGGDLRRLRELLQASRDGFTARRAFDPLPSNPVLSAPRRGGTDLLGESSWRALDTWSLHIDYWLGDTEIPFGWGAAEQRQRPVATRGEHGGSWRVNPRASRLASARLVPANGYLGLPEVRDVRQPSRQQDLRLRYGVALQLPADRIATADRLLVPAGIAAPGGGQVDAGPRLAGNALHALGVAEVFFQRPFPRADQRREYPSLFAPYWQARLVEPVAAERQLVATARGAGIDPWAVLP